MIAAVGNDRQNPAYRPTRPPNQHLASDYVDRPPPQSRQSPQKVQNRPPCGCDRRCRTRGGSRYQASCSPTHDRAAPAPHGCPSDQQGRNTTQHGRDRPHQEREPKQCLSVCRNATPSSRAVTGPSSSATPSRVHPSRKAANTAQHGRDAEHQQGKSPSVSICPAGPRPRAAGTRSCADHHRTSGCRGRCRT